MTKCDGTTNSDTQSWEYDNNGKDGYFRYNYAHKMIDK